MNGTDNVSKDGDHTAVEPQSTNQTIENTFSHILHEMKSESELIEKSLLLDA